MFSIHWPSLFLGLVCGIGLSIIAALCIGFRDARRDLREEDAMLEADRRSREEGGE